MNPDGTFVDEDGETEDYHVTDVSENDRKRLHYLKKQQRKEGPRQAQAPPPRAGAGAGRAPRAPRAARPAC